jgi:hypothetical protein
VLVPANIVQARLVLRVQSAFVLVLGHEKELLSCKLYKLASVMKENFFIILGPEIIVKNGLECLL